MEEVDEEGEVEEEETDRGVVTFRAADCVGSVLVRIFSGTAIDSYVLGFEFCKGIPVPRSRRTFRGGGLVTEESAGTGMGDATPTEGVGSGAVEEDGVDATFEAEVVGSDGSVGGVDCVLLSDVVCAWVDDAAGGGNIRFGDAMILVSDIGNAGSRASFARVSERVVGTAKSGIERRRELGGFKAAG